MDEFDDLEDLRFDGSQFYPESMSDEEYAQHRFPPDLVTLMLGNRGSGKSLYLARACFRALRMGMDTFTNLRLNEDFMVEHGITARPKEAKFEDLIVLAPQYRDCFLGVDEVGTWLHRQRTQSNAAIMASNMLGQLRKRRLSICCTTQQESKVTADLMYQTDQIMYCQDACWSRWGFERRVKRGHVFFYHCIDRSGVVTGFPGTRWSFVLAHADRLWQLYDSFQTQDTLAFATKLEFKREAVVMDSQGRVYPKSQARLVESEDEARALEEELRGLWATNFLQWTLDECPPQVAQRSGPWWCIHAGNLTYQLAVLDDSVRQVMQVECNDLMRKAQQGSPLATIQGEWLCVRLPEGDREPE